jgi:hypothetical protein
VTRGTEISLDATESYDPDDEWSELAYLWSMELAPDEADYTFSDVDSEQPVFVGQTLGAYFTKLAVTDDDDLTSDNPAWTVVEVVAYQNLEITLSWEEADVDLDLHLLQPGGDYYSVDDCFFANPVPDWGEAGSSADDCVLSTDDEGMGLGETVTIGEPIEGSYNVAVHLINRKNSVEDANPHVLVTANGEVVASIQGDSMDRDGDVWRVGTLDWSTLNWTDVDKMTTHDQLGGPPINE